MNPLRNVHSSITGKSWIIYPILLALPFILLELSVIGSFHQLPGPIYGGDIYWHYGRALHIELGEAPWTNPQVAGEYEYYGWITHAIISAYATGVDGFFNAYMCFAIVQTLLSSIAFFYLGRTIFKNNYAALLLAAISLGFWHQPSMGGTGDFILVPLFLAFFYKSLSESGRLNKILAGLFFGLASLAHVMYFPALLLFMAIVFIYLIFRDWQFRIKEGRFSFVPAKLRIKDTIKVLWIPALIGIIISLAFWGPVLIGYSAEIKNPVNIYANDDLSRFGLTIAYESIFGLLFNFSSLFALDIYGFVYSLLVLIGILAAIKLRDFRSKFLIALLVAALIGFLHFFITLPLLGSSFIPTRIFGALASPLAKLLFVSAIIVIWNAVKDKRLQKVIALVIIVVIVFNGYTAFGNLNKDQWVNAGRNQNYYFDEVSQWTMDNTNIDDVFLSHQELSFALNGISARKIMISRRTHSSPYIDIDQRLVDSAVILYGTNDEKRSELIQQYGIDYLYWDVNWLQFSAQEPILVDPKFDAYLTENGVAFQRVNTFLDPASGPRFPRYNVLAIGPVRDDIERPWSPQFDPYLELAKDFQVQNQTFARIFRVHY